jgi:hypothetical protein
MLDSVFTVSDKGMVESCNATAAQMFGCSIENARGTSSSLQATGRWLSELPMPHADARLLFQFAQAAYEPICRPCMPCAVRRQEPQRVPERVSHGHGRVDQGDDGHRRRRAPRRAARVPRPGRPAARETGGRVLVPHQLRCQVWPPAWWFAGCMRQRGSMARVGGGGAGKDSSWPAGQDRITTLCCALMPTARCRPGLMNLHRNHSEISYKTRLFSVVIRDLSNVVAVQVRQGQSLINMPACFFGSICTL